MESIAVRTKPAIIVETIYDNVVGQGLFRGVCLPLDIHHSLESYPIHNRD